MRMIGRILGSDPYFGRILGSDPYFAYFDPYFRRGNQFVDSGSRSSECTVARGAEEAPGRDVKVNGDFSLDGARVVPDAYFRVVSSPRIPP